MLVLVDPALAYKDALIDAVREFCAAGEYQADPDHMAAHFSDLLLWIERQKDPATVEPDQLPMEDFWLMAGDQWIGKLTLRTALDERFLRSGGHIGYEIRPSLRRRGYGTVLLQLGLEKARERGLHRVLLTCAETNIGSRKLIEANGGRLENAAMVDGVKKLRYWIDLTEGQLSPGDGVG